MKTFNVILETSIEAETQEEAETIAYNQLSIVQGDNGDLLDVHECRVEEAK